MAVVKSSRVSPCGRGCEELPVAGSAAICSALAIELSPARAPIAASGAWRQLDLMENVPGAAARLARACVAGNGAGAGCRLELTSIRCTPAH